MATPIAKSSFRRCRLLREQAGISITGLAASAGVGRDLLRSLEMGNPHTTHKAMRVFNALQEMHKGSLSADEELEPRAAAQDGTTEEQ